MAWNSPPIDRWKMVEDGGFPHKTLLRIKFFRTNFFVGPDDGHQNWEDVGFYDPDDPPPGASAWQNNNGQGYTYGPPTHWRELAADEAEGPASSKSPQAKE